MTVPTVPELTVDALEGDIADLFHHLHQGPEVVYAPAMESWVVVRHSVTVEVLTGSSFTVESVDNILERTIGRMMLTTDGPDHRRQRLPFARPLLPRALRHRPEQVVQETVAEVLSELPAGGGDLVAEFARPIVRRTILALLGLSQVSEEDIEHWFGAITAGFANQAGNPEVASRARRAFEAFAAELEERRRGLGPADLLHQVEQDLTDGRELASNTALTIFGAIETTAALITNALWALLPDGELVANLRDDPEAVPPLVEETLRWQSPVQTATRVVKEDLGFHGVELAAGDRLTCLLGAANRDPEVFPDPDRFDPGRPNASSHLAFARGAHFCLGAHLARLEGRMALQALLESHPGITPDLDRWPAPRGHEFRSSPHLPAGW